MTDIDSTINSAVQSAETWNETFMKDLALNLSNSSVQIKTPTGELVPPPSDAPILTKITTTNVKFFTKVELKNIPPEIKKDFSEGKGGFLNSAIPTTTAAPPTTTLPYDPKTDNRLCVPVDSEVKVGSNDDYCQYYTPSSAAYNKNTPKGIVSTFGKATDWVNACAVVAGQKCKKTTGSPYIPPTTTLVPTTTLAPTTTSLGNNYITLKVMSAFDDKVISIRKKEFDSEMSKLGIDSSYNTDDKKLHHAQYLTYTEKEEGEMRDPSMAPYSDKKTYILILKHYDLNAKHYFILQEKDHVNANNALRTTAYSEPWFDSETQAKIPKYWADPKGMGCDPSGLPIHYCNKEHNAYKDYLKSMWINKNITFKLTWPYIILDNNSIESDCVKKNLYKINSDEECKQAGEALDSLSHKTGFYPHFTQGCSIINNLSHWNKSSISTKNSSVAAVCTSAAPFTPTTTTSIKTDTTPPITVTSDNINTLITKEWCTETECRVKLNKKDWWNSDVRFTQNSQNQIIQGIQESGGYFIIQSDGQIYTSNGAPLYYNKSYPGSTQSFIDWLNDLLKNGPVLIEKKL